VTIRVNMKELTIDEIADVGQLIHDELGVEMDELMASPRKVLATAAFATVVMRRTDPTYSFAEARKLPMGEIEVADEVDSPDASNGIGPRPSLASGV
jgi:hypothetical protein